MVHCDVKPENILISFPKANFSWKAAIAKLTDFGIARGVNTSISEAVGSLPYMAPEQIEKIKKIGKINGEKPDVRWDLYAATVVLYEILEGKTPFEGKTEDLIEKITNDSPEMFRDDTPKGLKRIVYKGLEKNPADRYQTASDMLCDLEVFQYFNTEIIRVTEEIGGKYPDQPKAYLKLSEMYIYQSIEVLDHLRAEFESEQPDASTSFHIALLHGAANEYDEAEAAILETQQLDLENPAHPLKQEHPFIKRFVAPKVDDELPPEENTDSGEKDIDYTDKINEVKQLLSDGKYESARKAADEILNSCAKPEIYLSLCSLFYEEAISDQVIDICERGIKLHENHAELHAFLGRAAYGIDSKKAEKAIEKAIQLGYKDTDLVNRLKALKK
jgi:tetratricopeptide (TPR) repeat protein